MSICLKVCGKADTDWVTPMFCTDDKCSKFYSHCLLFVCIQFTMIQGDFLFPSELNLLSLHSGNVFVMKVYNCGVIQDCLTLLVTKAVGLSGLSAKVGLHNFLLKDRLPIWYLGRHRSCYSRQDCNA